MPRLDNGIPYGIENIEDWWNTHHKQQTTYYLTGSSLIQYLNFFKIQDKYIDAEKVLEVGIGKGVAARQIFEEKGEVYTVDISEEALRNVSDFAHIYITSNSERDIPTLDKLPTGVIDIAFSFLVAQHISDEMLVHHIRHVARSLKKTGVFCLQYAVDVGTGPLRDKQSLESQMKGGVVRTPQQIFDLVKEAGGGILLRETGRVSGGSSKGKDAWAWSGILICPEGYYFEDENKRASDFSIITRDTTGFTLPTNGRRLGEIVLGRMKKEER